MLADLAVRLNFSRILAVILVWLPLIFVGLPFTVMGDDPRIGINDILHMLGGHSTGSRLFFHTSNLAVKALNY